MSDKIIRDFLYGGHIDDGKFRMPDSSLFIGTGFEIGGAYEDWGFGVYRFKNHDMRLIAAGRTPEDAIKKARKMLRCDHVWEKNGWCNKCHGHKNFFNYEDKND